MSDKDDGEAMAAVAVIIALILGVVWVVEQILEWIADHSEGAVVVGVGLIGCLTLFGLWQLVRFINRDLIKQANEAKKLSQRRDTERRKEEQRKLARIQETYVAWLKSSPVDGAGADAERNEKELEQQLKDLRQLLCELQSRDMDAMLPTHREQHEETLAAVRAGIKTVESHARTWRERLIVLTAQRMLQCALRSVPPWLGGAPFEERPQGTDDLWPKKPGSIPAALAETQEALKKVDAAFVSMRKVEEQMAAELVTASREAKMHLQTLLERAQGLRGRLSTRLVECQTHEDRQRAFALIAKTPAGTLQAGTLDAFFPKDIDPIDTDLLMSVPQSFDLDDKLRELKAAVAHNVAAGAADHEVEALTQAPGGHVLPPRRPRTTR